MLKLEELKTRQVVFSDAKDLFDWRNDPETLQMFISQNEVPWDEHLKWLESALLDQSISIFISEIPGVGKLGSCRFNRSNAENLASVSLVINPQFRGKGYGVKVLQSSIDALQTAKGVTLKAKIKEGNVRSISTFNRAGFRASGLADDGLLVFERYLGK